MKVIVTGGAGFIGGNAALRCLLRGDDVVVIDNLARPGTAQNLQWLMDQGRVIHENIDIADAGAVMKAVQTHADAGLILHLAGQVAVTGSVADPRTDFRANAEGTFNLLEAARLIQTTATIVYSSTNKVYGGMEDIGIVLRDGRYDYTDGRAGIDETRNLDFHSPYGCSKGSADQYVRDYYRIYGLRTVVFRQSCIYGRRQFGLEDQGWIAWFIIATQLGRPITIYGDGRQVRDVLFIDDLLDAYDAAVAGIDRSAGQVYNVGGGRANTISLLDLVEYLGARQGRPIEYKQQGWRPGDQRCFISDNSKAARELGWTPATGWRSGLDALWDWVAANRGLFG
jgi:CDP-paratose 2-epimerase